MSVYAPVLRVFFNIDGELRSFYWFQCVNDDLYWGSSRPKDYILFGSSMGDKATISLESMEKLNIEETKYSYHESGKFHVKVTLDDKKVLYKSHMQWPITKAEVSPFRFISLLTSPPETYPKYLRNPTKKDGLVISIECLGSTPSQRFYIEAYICKDGNFNFPTPLVALNPKAKYKFVYQSINEKYLLAFRIWPLYGNHDLHHWNPELEICFYTE